MRITLKLIIPLILYVVNFSNVFVIGLRQLLTSLEPSTELVVIDTNEYKIIITIKDDIIALGITFFESFVSSDNLGSVSYQEYVIDKKAP